MNIEHICNSLIKKKLVCPWQLAPLIDNCLRPLVHNPQKIFAPYVSRGMTVLDVGCGAGFVSLGLAELVRKKKVAPSELVEEAIRRAEKANPELNAIVTPMYDQGRQSAEADLPDGPFAGVPFLLKDLLAAYAGVPMAGGCKALKNFIPDHDSEMVVRFKKAGLVIFGKTSTPEFGLKGVTEAELYGPCRNPWNTDHTPGGSSGGFRTGGGF